MGTGPTIAKSWRRKRVLVDEPEFNFGGDGGWAEDTPIRCPRTNSTTFATFPETAVRNGPTFPEGPIQLHYGEHFGPNRGFGFAHIWAEHHQHIDIEYDALRRVTHDLGKILVPEVQIFYSAPKPKQSPKSGKFQHRASAYRVRVGVVILELQMGENPFYSVVTGGFNPTGYKKGSLIGALK